MLCDVTSVYFLAMADLKDAISYALTWLDSADLSLKDEQFATIECLYKGKDVFAWLPTGFGKSLCFETIPFVYDWKLNRVSSNISSVALVISPLVSLMMDQVVNLRGRGVSAAIMSSGDSVGEELLAGEEELAKCSLLFCAPEALVGSKWREILSKPVISDRIVAVIIDEAHCVSRWYVLCTGTYM